MDKKILLVDDEDGIRKVLGISLADMGYEVFAAENGATAMEIFHKELPPIVLTDIKMPVMDGIALLKEIKRDHPDTQVIMLTGHGDMELTIKCLKLAATDFITKPIHDDILAFALNRAHEKFVMQQKLKEYTQNLEKMVAEKSARIVDSQQRYHQLFDEAPCYITVLDRSFQITAANKRFQDDFDYCPGAKCFSVYKQRETPCVECPVARTFADGKSHQCEMEVISKNNEKYYLLIWTAAIKDAAGNIDQVMEMATNITQVRKLQDQLSSLGLMIGSVSHGIKGLLTGLDGGMYLVDSGFAKENQAQIKEGWEIVRFMVGRIRSMVIDILYYAKEKDLKWEKVDVLSFANDLVRTITPRLKSEDILLQTRFESALGDFEMDAGIVHAALINILQNAIEACKADPEPKVNEIVFEIRQKDNFIEFQVQDNGIGMDEGTRQQIFKPFFSSKGEKGTGMGLFISNRIISQHGGEILLASTPGKGSTFTIRMPKTLPESVRAAFKNRSACAPDSIA